jgi:ZIP family zinc transporter
MNPILTALGLTLFAGLATGIGSLIAFVAKRTNYRFLAFSTAFSAGVMLYVSFVEIFVKGSDALVRSYGPVWGPWANVGSFFAGILFIGIIDNLIPAAENPHETHQEEEFAPLHDRSATKPATEHSHEEHRAPDRKLMRMGLLTALAITIHNFPEGLVTFLSSLHSPRVGVAIAFAVALHNIPEGISVSVPIFYATGDRRKAFVYSLLSGLAEPVGALVAYLVIRLVAGGEAVVVPPEVMGVLFGAVAGIMVYISLDELLPTSRAYGKGHDSLFGLVSGMAVMALSLLMMRPHP